LWRGTAAVLACADSRVPIRDALKAGKIEVESAVYDLASGNITLK